MSRQDDLKEIRELTIKLNQWCYEYYALSNPSVSNDVFDQNFDRLKYLEDKTGFFFSGSPVRTVGFRVSSELPKIKHSSPLLSLDKTKDRKVAMDFTKNREALLMYKLDGLTICLEYEDGKLVRAATRGNGEEGSIITDNAKTFVNVPLQIEYEGYLKVTGEGIIHRDDFEAINAQIPNADDRYKTPRNLASGSVQQLDSGVCAKRKVYFYAFNVLEGLEEINSLNGRLTRIKEFGFDVCKYRMFNPKDIEFETFDFMMDSMVMEAQKENIPIDGLVVMYDDIEYGKKQGRTGHHYRNGIAFKFKEEEEESVIYSIDWQVGRTGKITPVAVFDTVILDGTDVSRASLHNLSIIKELGIKNGAKVTIVKKNEIIPQIIKATGGTEDFEVPKVCPICGGTTTQCSDGGSVSLYCRNIDCAAQNIRKIAYFASKECMNIDGLSEKTVEKFIDAGIIKNILDIYKLENHHDEIVGFEGMGEKSFAKLLFAIEKSKNVKLENFIAGLGIQNIALSKAKIISRRFDGDWDLFENALKSRFDFTELESFGTEVNKCIYEFFDNVFLKNDMYSELVSYMHFVKEEKNSDVFAGNIFVITGSLNIFSNRKELQEKIESLGGKVAGGVSKKTTYLINNDIESSSSKNRDAKKNNVPIITEEEFLNMINRQK